MGDQTWDCVAIISLYLRFFVLFLDSDDCRVLENKANNLFHMVGDSKHGIRIVYKLNNEQAREYLKTEESY